MQPLSAKFKYLLCAALIMLCFATAAMPAPAAAARFAPAVFTVNANTYQVISEAAKNVALIETTQTNGDFVVPSTITYLGVTYHVTQVGGSYQKITEPDADTDSNFTYYKGSFSDKQFSSITIPDSVSKIADYAFYGINNLQKVTINSDEITIGKYAISYISGVFFDKRTLRVTAHKVTLEKGAFAYALMTKITINADQLAVGDYALANAPKGIKLPKGTTSIGDFAFDGCSGTFTIPQGVQSIGDGAFYKMQLKLAKGNKYFKIYHGVLYNKKGSQLIRAFDVPKLFYVSSGVTSLRKYAFAYSDVYFVATSHNIKKIPDYAFYKCPSLTYALTTKGTTAIGKKAFYSCDKLKKVHLAATIKAIGNQAFFNDRKLAKLKLPSSLQTIGERAFDRTAVAKVTIPASVNSIGSNAFGLDDNESSVKLNFAQGNAVFEQKGNIVYDKGTKTILMMILDASAEQILLPKGTKEIGNINLINFQENMELVIPASATSVDTAIFSYYTNNEDVGFVRFAADLPPSFIYRDNTVFHINAAVPAAAASAYRQAFASLPLSKQQTVNIYSDN